jgi:rubrerythrin
MKLQRSRKLAVAAALMLSLMPVSGLARTPWVAEALAPSAVRSAGETIVNLQTAFDGESNARARYTAFAEKADAEGYGPVASLFRAAARAEEIHAANHAAVLRSMGAGAKATIEAVDVKSTAENLTAAVAGESYERDTMYPTFIKQAEKAGNADAVRTLDLARAAEAEHARLYQEALSSLAAWRGSAKSFYVCPVCGFTTSTVEGLANCPSCFTPKEQFIVVR